jgi:hypothetical protein
LGERVQAGKLVYTVLEADWKAELSSGAVPKDRYLQVKVSVTNSGGQTVSLPGFALDGPGGSSYVEKMDDMGKVPDWFGMIRTVNPGETRTGYVVFDAPVGAYKLQLSDGGEIGSERHATVEIPAQLGD